MESWSQCCSKALRPLRTKAATLACCTRLHKASKLYSILLLRAAISVTTCIKVNLPAQIGLWASVLQCGSVEYTYTISWYFSHIYIFCVESVQTSSGAVIRDEGKSYDVSEDITGTDCSMNGRWMWADMVVHSLVQSMIHPFMSVKNKCEKR